MIAVLLGIPAACGLASVLIWGNVVHLRSASHKPAATTSHQSRVATTRHRTPGHSVPSHPGGRSKPARKKASPKLARVRLTAARNDSWVEIRKSSSSGRVLFAGIVRAGQSIQFVGRRLWARFGSLGNFDLTINGRIVHPAFNGTVDTVITASSIRPAPAPTG